MKKGLMLLLVFCYQYLSAQEIVNQVLVLNEGRYNYSTNQIEIPVTIGSYNPETQLYSVIDTIEGARFASDMLIDSNYFYVVADTLLLKYDLNTYQLLATQTVVGGRNICIVGQNLFITRGEYGIDLPSYLQVYSKTDLEFITEWDTLTGPKWTTQNMVLNGNKLFVAINNGFDLGNEKSLIGVLDVNSLSYLEEIDLGIEGTNPDNMMIDDNFIYTVNNKNWTGTSFSKVDLSTLTPSTITISDVSTGCGTSCLRGDKINFQLSMDSVLYEWNPNNFEDFGTNLGLNESFYELAYDNINNYLYASSTDFLSFGKVIIFNQYNSVVAEFDCGVSPGTIVFDVRNMVSINEWNKIKNEQSFYYDLSGKQLKSLDQQPKGVYIKSGTKKIIKIIF